MSVRSLVRDWVPPAIWRRARRLAAPRGGFNGNFRNWNEAVGMSSGYEDTAIIEKVLGATNEVRAGRASFERDSVLFFEPAPRYPLLAELLATALECDGELEVLEFGGALGSLYFQHRMHFRHLKRMRWSIVEQPLFVEAGRAHLENEQLRFFPSISEALGQSRPAICLASCVLQYLPDPRDTARELLGCAPKTILDRLPLVDGTSDRLTVQTVPAEIYSASYPAWFFSRSVWLDLVSSAGAVLANEFTSIDTLELDGRTFPSLGWVIQGAGA